MEAFFAVSQVPVGGGEERKGLDDVQPPPKTQPDPQQSRAEQDGQSVLPRGEERACRDEMLEHFVQGQRAGEGRGVGVQPLACGRCVARGDARGVLPGPEGGAQGQEPLLFDLPFRLPLHARGLVRPPHPSQDGREEQIGRKTHLRPAGGRVHHPLDLQGAAAGLGEAIALIEDPRAQALQDDDVFLPQKGGQSPLPLGDLRVEPRAPGQVRVFPQPPVEQGHGCGNGPQTNLPVGQKGLQDVAFLKEHVNVAIQGFTKIQGLKRQEKLKRVSVPFFVRVVFQVGSKLGQDPEKLPGVPLQIVHEGALGQDGGIVLEELLTAADYVIPKKRDAVLHRGGDGDLTKGRAAGGQPLRVGAADVAGGGGVIVPLLEERVGHFCVEGLDFLRAQPFGELPAQKVPKEVVQTIPSVPQAGDEGQVSGQRLEHRAAVRPAGQTAAQLFVQPIGQGGPHEKILNRGLPTVPDVQVQVAVQPFLPPRGLLREILPHAGPHQKGPHRDGPARGPLQKAGSPAGGKPVPREQPAQFLLVEDQVAGVQDAHLPLEDGVQKDIRGLLPAEDADREPGGESASDQGKGLQHRPRVQMVKIVEDQAVLFVVGEEQVQSVEEVFQKGGPHLFCRLVQLAVGPLGKGEPPKKFAYKPAFVVVVRVQGDPGELVALRGQPLRDGEAFAEASGGPDVDPMSPLRPGSVQDRVDPCAGQRAPPHAGRKKLFLLAHRLPVIPSVSVFWIIINHSFARSKNLSFAKKIFCLPGIFDLGLWTLFAAGSRISQRCCGGTILRLGLFEEAWFALSCHHEKGVFSLCWADVWACWRSWRFPRFWRFPLRRSPRSRILRILP